jgi:hypothetical protein
VLPLRHGDYERTYKLYCIEVVETNAVWMRVWSVVGALHVGIKLTNNP